jgi:glycosyltransferase involved in cell wall biosynthesis
MKLLYIANARIPTEKAHGLQIMKMCEAFGLAGVDLTLVLPGRTNTKELNAVNPFEYYQVGNNFKIKTLNSFDPVFLIGRRSGLYIKFQTLFFIFSLFVQLLFLKNKSEYIFYVRDEQLLPLLHLFSDRVVWEAHDLPQNRKLRLSWWRRCYRMVAISRGLKKVLVDLGLPAEKILVAPDAVDLAEFALPNLTLEQARQQLSLSLTKKLIVYTGHLYPWKGAEVLVNASRFLSADDLIILVGGTDTDVARFRKKSQHWSNVLIIGPKPHQEIPVYLKAADVLVLPNSAKSEISRTYTSPLKLFEYMAAGRPVVASDLPSLREVLNEKNCVFCQADNPESLAEAVDLVLKNKEHANQIAEQSFLDSKKYTWGNRAENIINFIKFP